MDQSNHAASNVTLESPRPAQSASELIDEERARQQFTEGFTSDHDLEHDAGDLARAAQCYERADPEWWEGKTGDGAPHGWPWAAEWWKPKSRLSNLVRAGALYQAEIDRLQRKRFEMERAIESLLASRVEPKAYRAKPLPEERRRRLKQRGLI